MAFERIKEKMKGLVLKSLVKKLMNGYKEQGMFYVKELYPGVFRLMNAGVHMDLFVGSQKALLWDTGNGYADLKAAVENITNLPLIVVNSHGHLDHSCGNYQFEQGIYIHPKDMQLCCEHNSRQMREYSAGLAKGMIGIKSPMGGVPEDFDADCYISQDCGKLLPVQEGSVFDLGGKILEVVELPGHTVGSIGLLYREEKVLFSGDAINNNIFLFLEHSTSLAEYRDTLRKALKLDFEEMIVSHGFKPVPKERLKLYLEFAQDPDFEHGLPFESPIVPEGAEVRQCIRNGMKPSNIDDPNYVCMVLSRDKLD